MKWVIFEIKRNRNIGNHSKGNQATLESIYSLCPSRERQIIWPLGQGKLLMASLKYRCQYGGTYWWHITWEVESGKWIWGELSWRSQIRSCLKAKTNEPNQQNKTQNKTKTELGTHRCQGSHDCVGPLALWLSVKIRKPHKRAPGCYSTRLGTKRPQEATAGNWGKRPNSQVSLLFKFLHTFPGKFWLLINAAQVCG